MMEKPIGFYMLERQYHRQALREARADNARLYQAIKAILDSAATPPGSPQRQKAIKQARKAFERSKQYVQPIRINRYKPAGGTD